MSFTNQQSFTKQQPQSPLLLANSTTTTTIDNNSSALAVALSASTRFPLMIMPPPAPTPPLLPAPSAGPLVEEYVDDDAATSPKTDTTTADASAPTTTTRMLLHHDMEDAVDGNVQTDSDDINMFHDANDVVVHSLEGNSSAAGDANTRLILRSLRLLFALVIIVLVSCELAVVVSLRREVRRLATAGPRHVTWQWAGADVRAGQVVSFSTEGSRSVSVVPGLGVELAHPDTTVVRSGTAASVTATPTTTPARRVVRSGGTSAMLVRLAAAADGGDDDSKEPSVVIIAVASTSQIAFVRLTSTQLRHPADVVIGDSATPTTHFNLGFASSATPQILAARQLRSGVVASVVLVNGSVPFVVYYVHGSVLHVVLPSLATSPLVSSVGSAGPKAAIIPVDDGILLAVQPEPFTPMVYLHSRTAVPSTSSAVSDNAFVRTHGTFVCPGSAYLPRGIQTPHHGGGGTATAVLLCGQRMVQLAVGTDGTVVESNAVNAPTVDPPVRGESSLVAFDDADDDTFLVAVPTVLGVQVTLMHVMSGAPLQTTPLGVAGAPTGMTIVVPSKYAHSHVSVDAVTAAGFVFFSTSFGINYVARIGVVGNGANGNKAFEATRVMPVPLHGLGLGRVCGAVDAENPTAAAATKTVHVTMCRDRSSTEAETFAIRWTGGVHVAGVALGDASAGSHVEVLRRGVATVPSDMVLVPGATYFATTDGGLALEGGAGAALTPVGVATSESELDVL